MVDVETAPDEALLAFADRSARTESGGRATLHSIVAASTLSFRVDDGGGFRDLELQTFEAARGDEARLVLELDAVLAPIAGGGGVAVTFNGRAHDFPVVARRACAHWLFDAGRYDCWRGRERHLDLMVDGAGASPGRWPSLVDACAALGVDAAPPRARPSGASSIGPAGKCQIDVVATYVLAGWDALAGYISKSPRWRLPHLLPFARHPHVATARRLMPTLVGAGA